MTARSGGQTFKWRYYGAVVTLCVAAFGCAPSRPEPPGPVTVTPVPPRVEDIEPAEPALPLVSGLFTYRPGVYRYEVVTESEIRRADSTATEALVTTTATLSLHLTQLTPDTLSATVSIDSAVVERDTLVPAPDSMAAAFDTAATLTMILDAHGTSRGDADASAVCGSRDPLLAAARDLLIPMRRELVVGATWSDTVTVNICRGGVPLTTGVVRDYEVLGSRRDTDGMPLMRVARKTSFSMAGTETTEHRQIIALTGRGESNAILELDLRSGIVRSASREGTADISVSYGRSTTPFAQRVTQRIRLVDAVPTEP